MISKEKTAMFIGNRDCYQVKAADIEKAIISVIDNGIEVFLNGGQGYFDKICAVSVHRLKKRYPHIKNILDIDLLVHFFTYKIITCFNYLGNTAADDAEAKNSDIDHKSSACNENNIYYIKENIISFIPEPKLIFCNLF